LVFEERLLSGVQLILEILHNFLLARLFPSVRIHAEFAVVQIQVKQASVDSQLSSRCFKLLLERSNAGFRSLKLSLVLLWTRNMHTLMMS
jgi:hypothetical protein